MMVIPYFFACVLPLLMKKHGIQIALSFHRFIHYIDFDKTFLKPLNHNHVI
jgi:hypothetical protein